MPQWLIKNQPQGNQELREERDGQQDGNCEKMHVFTTSQYRPSGRSCRQTLRAQTAGSLRPTSERVATCMNMANLAANCLQRDLPRNLKLRRRATGGLTFWQLLVAQLKTANLYRPGVSNKLTTSKPARADRHPTVIISGLEHLERQWNVYAAAEEDNFELVFACFGEDCVCGVVAEEDDFEELEADDAQ